STIDATGNVNIEATLGSIQGGSIISDLDVTLDAPISITGLEVLAGDSGASFGEGIITVGGTIAPLSVTGNVFKSLTPGGAVDAIIVNAASIQGNAFEASLRDGGLVGANVVVNALDQVTADGSFH